MDEKRIKYFASFDIAVNIDENRVNILSSASKINYIITVLNEIGYGVDVVSYSHTLNKKCYAAKKLKWGSNTIKLFPTTWRGGIANKILNGIVLNVSLLLYVLRYVQRGEIVIKYHSYGVLWLNILFAIKGVHLIEECEEIYGCIYGKKWMSFLEKTFLTKADSYIFPTACLNSIINTNNKPFIIVHGAYRDVGAHFFSDYRDETIVFDKNLFHVAYTGILDPKKGCMDIIKAAAFLDETYYIHILGFGSRKEIEDVSGMIDEISVSASCHISFDGLRKGREYTNYLRHINLGVCTLDTNRSFVNTQFPSKIISYMSAGVPVLCSEVPAILTCDVSSAITFYKGNTPKDIAEGIKCVKSKQRVDVIQLLENCDLNFHNQIKALLQYESHLT